MLVRTSAAQARFVHLHTAPGNLAVSAASQMTNYLSNVTSGPLSCPSSVPCHVAFVSRTFAGSSAECFASMRRLRCSASRSLFDLTPHPCACIYTRTTLATWRLPVPQQPGQLLSAASGLLTRRQLHYTGMRCKAALKDAEAAIKRVTRDDVIVQFVRSSGAGGQNVNKVSTKVDMRFNIRKVDWLEEDVKAAVMEMEKNRINKAGELVISSQKTRSQLDNLEDALQKLQEILDAAWVSVQPIEEDPEKKKKLEKAKKAAKEARLKEKKLKAEKKGQRRARIDY